MPKVENNTQQYYSKFDRMSTKELEEFLRIDAELPDDKVGDIEEIIYVTELLSQRKNIEMVDVDTAWHEFNEKYLPYTDTEPLHIFDDSSDTHEQCSKKKQKHFWRKAASVAAAIVLILFSSAVTASAFGYNPWKAIAEWTDSIFWLNTSDNHPTAELQQVLNDYGIYETVIPQWLPEGYEYDSVEIDDDICKTNFLATFLKQTDNGIDIIYININYKVDDYSNAFYEKDADDVLIYVSNDIKHYIMTNLDIKNIIWQNADTECCITGRFTQDEAEKMIDSIYGE